MRKGSRDYYGTDYQGARGTQDFTPEKSARMRYIEDTLWRIAGLHGFGEIRTPTFEHTELFVRSVGDTTDVVQKEMYTFEDKKGRSITLKPEGTAGAVRAALERGLMAEALPLKLSYITPCFRYEKAQARTLPGIPPVRRGAAGRPELGCRC